jgi:hypothetical protein
MHFHLPKPLHGWRALAGEVGIIVIGVLIALGAEQLVDNLRWRHEVASFRTLIDHELGRNLGIYELEIAQRPCTIRRLADLDRFLSDAYAGRHDTLLRPVGHPFVRSLYFSGWDNKGNEVVDHLPMQLRRQYGELYDELRNDQQGLMGEVEVWRSMSVAGQSDALDHADRVRLHELLNRAEQLNQVAKPNFEYAANLARALHIEPIGDRDFTPARSNAGFCDPLLPANSPG